MARDPPHNLQFFPQSEYDYGDKKDFIVSWTSSGRVLFHPYSIDDKTWRSTLLYGTSELSYLAPGFNVNNRTSYVNLLNVHKKPHANLCNERYNHEIACIGNHVTWLNSVKSCESKEIEDQILMIQLSKLGDVYTECFDFQITPSPKYKSTSLWYNSESHEKEILIRKKEEKKIVHQKDFYIYDFTSVLSQMIKQAQKWNKPRGYDLFISKKAPKSTNQIPVPHSISLVDVNSILRETFDKIIEILATPHTL